MGYEASAHEAQMAIMKHLLHVPDAGFAQLQKATGLSSDHFNFHIKKLVSEDLVAKNDGGKYHLTHKGKEYANRMDTDNHVIEKQPKLSVGLIIENDKGEFVAQQRLKQPYYGFWGRPTGKIRWSETVLEAAARELEEETGLTADLEFKGIYHKMDHKDSGEFLEDKYFYIVHGTNPKGTLMTEFEGGRNAWLDDKELIAKDKVFESIPDITDMAKTTAVGFMEKKYYYSDNDY
jgi:ADP-ribose pyrophosphatase YjhB (NUDIX family)/predicted transcriptional regulator